MTATSTELRLTPSLTPHGRLVIVPLDDAPALEPALGERIRQAFGHGAGHGLLRLGAAEVGQVLPPVFAYWRELGNRFVTALCTRPETQDRKAELPPPPEDLEALAAAAPLMPGAEYLTADVLRNLWAGLGEAFTAELAEARTVKKGDAFPATWRRWRTPTSWRRPRSTESIALCNGKRLGHVVV